MASRWVIVVVGGRGWKGARGEMAQDLGAPGCIFLCEVLDEVCLSKLLEALTGPV